MVIVFFFKQKTAYELRISDWSSDVCSSDLFERTSGTILDMFNMFSGGALERLSLFALGVMPYISASIIVQLMTSVVPALEELKKEGERSGESRVGKECVSTCRSRWSPSH